MGLLIALPTGAATVVGLLASSFPCYRRFVSLADWVKQVSRPKRGRVHRSATMWRRPLITCLQLLLQPDRGGSAGVLSATPVSRMDEARPPRCQRPLCEWRQWGGQQVQCWLLEQLLDFARQGSIRRHQRDSLLAILPLQLPVDHIR